MRKPSARKRSGRALPGAIALGASLALVAGFGVAAGASTAAGKKPPVDIEGNVDNHGKARVRGDSVTIEADDFYFEKTFLRGKPGTTIEVTVENAGSASHTFTIDEQDIDEELDADDTVEVSVQIPDSGEPVVFYCRFHEGQGMKGAFFTKKARGSGSGRSGSGSSRSSGGTTGSTAATTTPTLEGGFGY